MCPSVACACTTLLWFQFLISEEGCGSAKHKAEAEMPKGSAQCPISTELTINDSSVCSEWASHQHRDSIASYIGGYSQLAYFAVAENEPVARIRYKLLEVCRNMCMHVSRLISMSVYLSDISLNITI